MKTCNKCNETKELTEYYKNIGEKDGLQRACKECGKKIKKIYYSDPRKKIIARHTFIRNFLKRTYGITYKEYRVLLKNQNERCAICFESETQTDYRSKKVKMLAVDHCHTNNKVRSLLCRRCNQVLGLVKENKIILKTMIDYLTLWNAIFQMKKMNFT